MYIVTEIQTYTNGTVATLTDSFSEQQAAESKYHTVLAAAAVSNLPKHAVILYTEEGFPMLHKCYMHTVTAEPVPETAEVAQVEQEPEQVEEEAANEEELSEV